MSGRKLIVAIGVGAVIVTALAAVNLKRPADVAWEELSPAEAEVGNLQELRTQLEALQQSMPATNSQALAAIRVPDAATLCGQEFPLDRPAVRDALAYELLLTAGRPLMPMLWTRRAPTVMPTIDSVLEEKGLPSDLKYLAMIESDLRLSVRSPAGAEGLWQFMRATGRRYGLTVDKYLDERRDPELATAAAAEYLEDLHDQFGDWFIAVAAYNSGETRLKNAIEEQGELPYFDLYLPHETRRYVYRMMAAKLIYENPGAYGVAALEPLEVPRYRHVEVQVKSARADLRELAREHGLAYGELRLSNPKLRGPWLPRGTHKLRIPGENSGERHR